jgi:hypothetical protein
MFDFDKWLCKTLGLPMDNPNTFTDDDFNEAEQDNYIDEFNNKEHE